MRYTPSDIVRALSGLNTMRDNATDAQASLAPMAYRSLKMDGSLVRAGTRVAHKGELYRARVDLYDTDENTPDAVPSLWDKVMYKRGIRIIPEQIVAENPFAKGEIGWWGDKQYKSLIDANVWTPAAYPSGWEEVVKE